MVKYALSNYLFLFLPHLYVNFIYICLTILDRVVFVIIHPRIEEDIQEGRMLERECSNTEYKNKKKK